MDRTVVLCLISGCECLQKLQNGTECLHVVYAGRHLHCDPLAYAAVIMARVNWTPAGVINFGDMIVESVAWFQLQGRRKRLCLVNWYGGFLLHKWWFVFVFEAYS